jgi:hypothetical protein
MDDPEVGCGPLYACYLAARRGDADAMRSAWQDADDAVRAAKDLDEALLGAVGHGETDRVAAMLEPVVFARAAEEGLEGPIATVLGKLLWTFGYVAAFVLFLGAHSRKAIVGRLRWAYRTVGVDLRAVESVEGVERTVFRCPYRTVGTAWWGERRLCHEVLDRVDDGYVSYLENHRAVDYDRPRPCAGGPCCYSEVREA